jgi:hypothetical protein
MKQQFEWCFYIYNWNCICANIVSTANAGCLLFLKTYISSLHYQCRTERLCHYIRQHTKQKTAWTYNCQSCTRFDQYLQTYINVVVYYVQCTMYNIHAWIFNSHKIHQYTYFLTPWESEPLREGTAWCHTVKKTKWRNNKIQLSVMKSFDSFLTLSLHKIV